MAEVLTHRLFNKFSFCVGEIPNTTFKQQQQKDMDINPMFLYINHA